MILFDSVTKRFGNRTILDEVNFEIKPGEFISIVGDSGAGKTTIIKLILGIERPSEGRITVHDQDLIDLEGNALQNYRRNIGTIFQNNQLLPKKSVFENVAFALEACDYSLSEIMELVPRALGGIGISHLQDHFPHELSGGEAQRVALARAIVHRPKLILADEPTGNLDFENAKQVLKKLMEINLTGVPVILTTHNRPLVDLAGQKVLHLEHGRLE